MKLSKIFLPLLLLSFTCPVLADEIDVDTYFTPHDAEIAESRFVQMIDKAQSKIRMAAYGFTDPLVSEALLRAKSRNVDVQIIMDATEAAGAHQKGFVYELEQAGIKMYIGKSPVHNQLLHSKFTVVDDLYVEDGSWNYSPSASQQFNVLNFTCSAARAKRFTDAWNSIQAYLANKSINRRLQDGASVSYSQLIKFKQYSK